MEALINWKRSAPDKPSQDAAMILAHQRAIEMLLGRVGEPLSIALLDPINGTLVSLVRTDHRMASPLELMIAEASTVDPVNAAVFLMTRLPYLQPFLDGNRRTSRLVANLPLLKAGLNPFSFVGIDKTRYIEGMGAFYERGDDRLIRDAFIDAYGHTALCSKTSNAEQRVLLTNERDEVVKQLKAYVLDGTRPEHELLAELIPKSHDLMRSS